MRLIILNVICSLPITTLMKNKRWILLLTLLGLLGSCASDQNTAPSLTTGRWRFVLELKPGVELPFIAEVGGEAGAYTMLIYNAEERLPVEEIRQQGDSVFIQAAVFDSEFKGKLQANGQLTGLWYDYSRGPDYRIPFTATPGEAPRFRQDKKLAPIQLAPRYAMGFSVGTPDAFPAIGVFEQGKQGYLTGTILTETGDYRYLDGLVRQKQVHLSAFDGSHAYLFTGEAHGDTLRGTFYSGSHWEEPWMAVPSETAQLRDPDELTYLKEGYDAIEFSFPNPEGEMVSLSDERYDDKVVIVQLLGSWCPNCMDETRLFADWHEQYHEEGLEIIGLAFERAKEPEQAWENIARMKESLGVNYEILLAANSSSKSVASDALPMLNQVMSFPTSIYIDRQGRIRKIHTGFYGPGTGAPYERFVEQYSDFIQKMLKGE